MARKKRKKAKRGGVSAAPAELPDEALEAEIEVAETRLEALSWRRRVAGEHVRIELAEPPPDLVLVLRVLGGGL